ncbi:hypothetical protein PPL_10309 [Heterostelium album PN500]|uniref:Origin recognition complex subunit 5 C-terminal domain-containing protein n=1 Tax=Heterostelium pallidum (strain ATCC 26659 / Pp 5 / PN500) TaxID=670386 RepID=D3BPZ0_HETP5|nr:hypothetical protein PPL_10309 [Heterostelium album PN500]EFA76541.1 hypothetical protein PPL_10309 [Heterostelium album PN500]|eukprot:XP_020428673.1 hypothetical protein PPL_10309 [Heterostelium album PN500]
MFSIFPQLNTTRYNSILFSQIASLVSLRLFDESGTLESIRLRCNVPYQNIKLVCLSINFDIDLYLNSAEFTNA